MRSSGAPTSMISNTRFCLEIFALAAAMTCHLCIRYSGNKAIVSFYNGQGLHATQTPIPFVQVAGSNMVFYSATATINDAGELEASSPSVSAPKAIRYCYTRWHLSTIFNDARVPLAPFRSDR